MRTLFAISVLGVFFSSVICLPKYKVDEVLPYSGVTEGFLWDERINKLIFEDVFAKKLCSFDPKTSKLFCAHIEKLASFAVSVDKTRNQFVVGAGLDILLVTWDCDKNVKNPPTRSLISLKKEEIDNRINEGRADALGRLWFGTLNYVKGVFGKNKANFYSLESNLTVKLQIPNVSASSGVVFSIKNDKLYYCDALSQQVAVYDFDLNKGSIANRQVLFDFKANNISGLPTRLTIDTNGNLWVPAYGGSKVIQIDPKTKQLLRTIDIPAKRVGTVIFGGPSRDIMYVATVGYGLPTGKNPADDPKSGSIFAVTGLGVKGLSAYPFKLNA